MTRANGSQEFGELKATVQGLAKAQDEFRTESKEMRKEILDSIEKLKAEIVVRMEKNEAGLDGLKKWRWYVAGAATGGGAVASWAIKLIHG